MNLTVRFVHIITATLIMVVVGGLLTFADKPPSIEQQSCGIAEADGSFPVLVCKGDGPNARCFCCNPVKNVRTFGWSWSTSAENMTCACSRERDRLGRNDVSLHCTEDGNYEKLQCDNGLCWCVVPKTGEPTERLYPESMMKHLPCYLEKTQELRKYYQRQCESKALARLAILRKLVAHGINNAHIDMPRCDYDGSYKAIKLTKKVVNCVWKDEKKIDNYESNVADISKTNCQCARDTVIYSAENMEFSLVCGGNGNYDPTQTSNGMPYCVDSDGFPTTELGNEGEIISCP